MKRLLILALAAAAPMSGCLHPAPVLHATAAQIGPELDNYSEAVIPEGGTIVLQGDDTIYGGLPHGHRAPINGADEKRGGVTLADSLHRSMPHVTIVDHGFPGDTVAKSAERWAGRPVGNLLILSFGYGDVHAQTPVAAFTTALTKLVHQAQTQGAAVFIVTPPPTTGKDRWGLAVYREAAMNVGAKEGVAVFDSTDTLQKTGLSPSKDDHASADITQAIAGAMVPYIQVIPEPKAKG